jgi:hypothetical protein
MANKRLAGVLPFMERSIISWYDSYLSKKERREDQMPQKSNESTGI